jgi:hypothetical protein
MTEMKNINKQKKTRKRIVREEREKPKLFEFGRNSTKEF